MAEFIAAIIPFLKLAFLILTEIFAAKKIAREAQQKYDLNRLEFLAIAQKCLDRMRTESVKEAQQAQDVEDQVDEALEKGKK